MKATGETCAAAPLTLTEFEREAGEAPAAARRNDRFGRPSLLSDYIVRHYFRPLILRLLAGERERCASLVRTRADAHTEAMCAGEREAIAACMFADNTAAAIRNMGDPE